MNALLQAAASGNLEAARIVLDRVEGKPVAPQVDLTERVREVAIQEGLDPDEAVRVAEEIARRYNQ